METVERAELLCDLPNEKVTTKRMSLWVSILAVAVLSPALSVIPFSFALEGEGADPQVGGQGLSGRTAMVREERRLLREEGIDLTQWRSTKGRSGYRGVMKMALIDSPRRRLSNRFLSASSGYEPMNENV